jgi:hypothetical protein
MTTGSNTAFVSLRMYPIARDRFNNALSEVRKEVPFEIAGRAGITVSVMMAALLNVAASHPGELADAVTAILEKQPKRGSELE